MLNEKNTNNSKNLQTSLRSFRRAFTLIVILNMVFVIEHTVIDFMGFMFGMIIADLAYLLFLVVGLFGAYQYRVNYIVICTLISLGWIAWNIFVICVYLNIGFLNRYDPFVLNLSTGKKSWFFTSSFGCRTEITAELEQIQLKDQLNAVRTLIEASSTTQSTLAAKLTSSVDFDASSLLPLSQNGYRYMENFIHSNCLVPFYLIEIIHSGLFIFLGIFCVIFGLLLSNTFNEDDDTFDYIGGFDTPHVISSTYNSDHHSHHQITLPRNGLIRLDPIYVSN